MDIKQAKLSVLSSEQQLLQSKLSLFPSLNSGGSQGYNYGRTVDPYSNEFTNLNVKTNNFSLFMKNWGIRNKFRSKKPVACVPNKYKK